MAVRHHEDGDNSLGLPRGENRDAPLAQVVGTGACACDAGRKQDHGGGGVGVNKDPGDVVASHPLFASLFKEISVKYPQLEALVPEISKVARAAVATPKSTATPAEQREESLQTLRKATNKSASAEEGPCANTTRSSRRRRRTLEDLQATTAGLEEKLKDARAELSRAPDGVMATRLATPTAQERISTSRTHRCKKLKQPWPEQGWSQPQSEGRQTVASVMRPPERKLNWIRPSMTLAALLLVVSLMWGDVHPSQLSSGNGEPKFRIFSVNISSWSPQAEGFLRSAEVGCFQTVALAGHQLGANSINKRNKLWKQSGFRDTAATARQSETSTTGTSGGTGIATRSHVTLAAWSMEKSDVVCALGLTGVHSWRG